SLFTRAQRQGVRIAYDHKMTELLVENGEVCGVVAVHNGRVRELRAGAVVLAAGGFHANTEWRARYLGTNWDLAKVRGSRYNTGLAIQAALNQGARAAGHWTA